MKGSQRSISMIALSKDTGGASRCSPTWQPNRRVKSAWEQIVLFLSRQSFQIAQD